MCEANAFVLIDGKEKKLLENVDLVSLEGDNVKLVSIFGEQKTLKAKLKQYNNTEGKIIFEIIFFFGHGWHPFFASKFFLTTKHTNHTKNLQD